MTRYITRAYNSFSFNYRNSTLKKYSKEERLKQEAEYYKALPDHLKIYFPRLLSAGFDDSRQEHFLELELYPYENLGKLLIEGKLTEEQWTAIARYLADVLADFSQNKTSAASFSEDLRAMFLTKTQDEYKKLVEGFEPFKKLAKFKTVILNGKEYLNFEQVWAEILKKYQSKLIDSTLTPSVIHGDFCFSNILVGFLPDGKAILRFVDPRGKFGSLAIHGDPYYDLAKLMHSTDIGYEYFIYDQFEIKQDADNSFSLAYANPHKKTVDGIFHKELYAKYDATRIKLIQATIYIGMCARHYDSASRQMAMYLSGVKLLNEILS